MPSAQGSQEFPCWNLCKEVLSDVSISRDGRQVLAVGASSGNLVCAEASTGRSVWKAELGSAPPHTEVSALATNADWTWLCYGAEQEDGNHHAYIAPLSHEGPDLAKKKLLGRFTLPVRQVAFHVDPAKTLLAIGSDDAKLFVLDFHEEDFMKQRQEHTGMKGAVRGLAFDPAGEFLAAACVSGHLHVYRLGVREALYSSQIWPKSLAGDGPRRAPVWQPGGGGLVALPGAPQTTELQLIKRGTWERHAVLSGGHRFAVSAATWNLSGDLLVTASDDSIVLWKVGATSPIWKRHQSAKPQHLALSAEALAAGMHDGTVCVISGKLEEMSSLESDTRIPEVPSQDMAGTKDGLAPDSVELPPQTEKIPRDGDAKGDLFADEESTMMRNVQVPPQPPLQPGATSGSRRHFLAWNEHGAAKFYAAGAGSDTRSPVVRSQSQLEAEFFGGVARTGPRSSRAPEGLALGSIGPGVCALALRKAHDRAAKLVVHSAAEWGKPVFEKSFSDREEVEALAVGRSFVAAATSRCFLHVLSLTGLPIGLVTIPGKAVMLVASEDLLLVVFHSGPPDSEDQSLDYWLLAAKERERLSVGRLPLSRGATVRWAGFSAEALPLVLDSSGMLRGLCRGAGSFAGPQGLGGSWVPLLDLDAAAKEGRRLWPVRAECGELMCVDVPKGSEPEAGPNHRLVPIKFRLPIGGSDGAEESMLRESLLSSHLRHTMQEGVLPANQRRILEDRERQCGKAGAKSALRLFKEYADVDDVEKALDVALYFKGDYTAMVNQAAKAIADRRGLTTLADRVAELTASVATKRPATAEADGAPPARSMRITAR